MAVRIFYTWSADLPERHYSLPPLTGGYLVHQTTATLLPTEAGYLAVRCKL